MSFDHLFEGGLVRAKFEPCLDVARRSAILALLRRGVKPIVLARMYSINRHTVHTIGRDTSPHYRAVRQEYAELGREGFEKKYLTEGVIKRALALNRGEVESSPGGLRPDPYRPSLYNKRAVAKEGNHVTFDAFDMELAVLVKWCKPFDDKPEAWYYRETASADGWTGPYYTSSYALDGARQSKTQEELDG